MKGCVFWSPLPCTGERARVRGFALGISNLNFQIEARPLTPALSPEYRGEGVRSI
jgi:hypothetical protein